jgi:hypothetical protein
MAARNRDGIQCPLCGSTLNHFGGIVDEDGILYPYYYCTNPKCLAHFNEDRIDEEEDKKDEQNLSQ